MNKPEARRRSPIYFLSHGVAMLVGAVLTVGICLVEIPRSRLRRARTDRVVLGLTPIINIKYWAAALRTQGVDARTFVYDVYPINDVNDFDCMPEAVFPRLRRLPAFSVNKRYASFVWALRSFDIFIFDFDGGFLRHTVLAAAELRLLKLAGKRLLAIAYGGDVEVVSRSPDPATRRALADDYPHLVQQERSTAKRIDRYCRWVDVVLVGGALVDYVPRVDIVAPSFLCLDVEAWRPVGGPNSDGTIRVLHAPNHRTVKGTASLEAACDRLRSEGLPIELVILNRVPNREVRAAMATADIVASAFVMGYYELFAIEGMSMEKPVMNYWRPDLWQFYSTYSFAGECPIVDSPIDDLVDVLRALAEDPDRRSRLGALGREYVIAHHSYEAVGKLLAGLLHG